MEYFFEGAGEIKAEIMFDEGGLECVYLPICPFSEELVDAVSLFVKDIFFIETERNDEHPVMMFSGSREKLNKIIDKIKKIDYYKENLCCCICDDPACRYIPKTKIYICERCEMTLSDDLSGD